MQKERVSFLCQRYLSDDATSTELRELETVLADPAWDEELKRFLSESYYTMPAPLIIDRRNTPAYNATFEYIINHQQATKSRKLWTTIAIAASMTAALISAGLYIYQKTKQDLSPVQFTQDIAPGKTGATLTLSNGKRIFLADAANGKIATETGIKITKTKDGELIYEIVADENDNPEQMNTLSTANGEIQKIKLQDGTIVFLNAASSITYPSSFASAKTRKVELKGEGYFEVAKDKVHPFIVRTRNEEVEVLGTHFNINAYLDEPAIKTALLEGSIRLNIKTNNNQANQSKVLKPGEEASLKANNTISINPVDEEETLAWKNGIFVFNDESLESIMRKVSKWYNVEVYYEGVNKNEIFGGSVNRNANVSEVLKALSMTNGVSFRIENRKIYVMPPKTK